MTSSVSRAGFAAFVGALGVFTPQMPASAQVYYARPADNPLTLLPQDETLGTSPSFVIAPYAYGGPAVRVVERCQYPNGWNVTDFGRDVNGIPNGLDHTCPTAVGGRVRARY